MQLRQGTLKTIQATFRGYYRHLTVLTVFGIVAALLDGIGINALVPLLSFLFGDSSTLSDNFITTTLRSFFAMLHIPFTFRYLLIFIGGLFLLRALTLAAFTYVRARVSTSFMYRETSGLMSLMLSGRWGALLHEKPGYLQNTLYWDVKRSATLLDAIVQFLQSGTGFLIYIVIALSISPTITLITLIAGGILLILLHPLVRKTVLLGEEHSVAEKGFVNLLVEAIQGLKSIKASGVEAPLLSSSRHMLLRLRSIFMKSTVVQMAGTTLIQPFSFVFIIVLFAVAYRLPTFNLAAFVATIYLVQKIFTYLQSAQASLHTIGDQIPFARNMVAFKERFAVVAEREQETGRPFSFKRELSFSDVTLSYTPELTALFDVSFTLPRGSVLGLVGPSGGGKTSIADLALRLNEPSKGSLTLDGIPVDNISLRAWRERVSYVSQDLFLLDATVEDNIRFFDAQVTRGDIERAARQAYIYDDIMKLPEGFRTPLGSRGTALSYGQRQRVVLARALARKPELLILDEATSALDSQSEQAIKRAIAELKGSTTLLIIAHRLATILDADEVLVLKEGSIVERGKPEELLARSGSYLATIHGLQSVSHNGSA
jgi:ABC-type multidrug transport system fused ATPase/permease subunit